MIVRIRCSLDHASYYQEEYLARYLDLKLMEAFFLRYGKEGNQIALLCEDRCQPVGQLRIYCFVWLQGVIKADLEPGQSLSITR